MGPTSPTVVKSSFRRSLSEFFGVSILTNPRAISWSSRAGTKAMTIHDITIPMSDSLACWPGDAPFRFSWTWRKSDGAAVNVGQVQLSIHAGTHTDAPFHFDDAGVTAELLSLNPFIGPARVIPLGHHLRFRRADLEQFDLSGTPRVLFRTDGWSDHTCFPSTISVMEPDVPEWLHQQGVILVGVDVPSVDDLDSKTLPNHHALGEHGIAILESLDLSRVPGGLYELIALPLKLVGADGAPVRAILRG
jgi:arylformamidase